MPRLVLARQSREARKHSRAALGRLHDCRVAPKTLTRYLTAVSFFSHWVLCAQGALGDSWEILDSQVMAWIEALWEEGKGKHHAADALSGIQHLMSTQRVLIGS